MTLPVIGDILAQLRIRPTEKSVEKFLKILFHDPEKIPKNLAEKILKQRLEWGFEEWRKWYLKTLHQGVGWKGQKINFLEKIPELKIPTLVIGGKNDRIIPSTQMQNVLNMSYKAWLLDPSKTLVRYFPFENCGHWPQMEKSEEFNQIVSQFLFARSKKTNNKQTTRGPA